MGQFYDFQKSWKIHDLQQKISSFSDCHGLEFLTVPKNSQYRDRLDFVYSQGRLGLYQKKTVEGPSTIVDIKDCAQLSQSLLSWLTDFRQIRWPIEKGSIRLRVGPQGQRGAWLDFANLDIKNLLSQKGPLSELEDQAVVEVGQRRKRLKFPRLVDPQPELWFESHYGNQTVPLYCYIGSFTQPGFQANKILVCQIAEWIQNLGLKKGLEWGAGIGNLSIAVLPFVEQLSVFENDSAAIDCFKKTISEFLPQEESKIAWNVGDFQRSTGLMFHKDQFLLVNPPRSGLRHFLDDLGQSKEKPRAIIYMSCHPDSWTMDSKKLIDFGYSLEEVKILDQFAQTQHYEILSLFKRKEL